MQHEFGGFLHARQEVGIAQQIGDAQLRKARLARAEKLARTAQRKIAARDLKAVEGLADHFAVARAQAPKAARDTGARRCSPSGAASDAAAQLVQLGKTHALGVLDHHERRIGHVDAHLDHRRRDEKLDLARLEGRHRRVLLRTGHAAVHESDPHVRQRLRRGGSRVSSTACARSSSDSSIIGTHPVGEAARAAGLADAHARSHRGAAPGTTTVCTGVRPGGSSSITEMSRSAKAVIASVRGIGVAVMMS